MNMMGEGFPSSQDVVPAPRRQGNCQSLCDTGHHVCGFFLLIGLLLFGFLAHHAWVLQREVQSRRQVEAVQVEQTRLLRAALGEVNTLLERISLVARKCKEESSSRKEGAR